MHCDIPCDILNAQRKTAGPCMEPRRRNAGPDGQEVFVMNIGDRIKKVREAEGKNQREFASSIKVGQSTLAMFENGQREPKSIHIEQICLKYDVSESWLRTGAPPMYREPEERLETYLGQISKGEDEFIRDLIEVYMELDQASKDALKEIARRMAEKQNSRGQ